MSNAYEEFMKQMIQPMRQELTDAGFEELTTEEAVKEFMNINNGTTLVFVNSVCGCAGGLARPAATQVVLNSKSKPNHLVTVFAGQDKEATAKMREYFVGYEPSSPSLALLKDNEVIHFIPRHEIEGHSIEDVMDNLSTALSKYCS